MHVPSLSLTARNVLSRKSNVAVNGSTARKFGWVANLSTIAEVNCRKWAFSPLRSIGPLGTVDISSGSGKRELVRLLYSDGERVLRELDAALGHILLQTVALTEFARKLDNVFVPAFLGDVTESLWRCRRRLTQQIEHEREVFENSRMTGSPVPIIAGQTTQPGNQSKERKK